MIVKGIKSLFTQMFDLFVTVENLAQISLFRNNTAKFSKFNWTGVLDAMMQFRKMRNFAKKGFLGRLIFEKV